MSNGYSEIPMDQTTPPLHYPRIEEKNISIIKELSPREDLQDTMYQLEGKVWDKKTQDWIKIEGAKELMNSEGRDAFFHYATAMISPIVTMSNYTNNYKMVHNLMRYQIKRAIIHFYLNYKKYNIEITKINIVISKLLILGLSAFYKAIGAGDRKAATSHITESISRILRPTLEGEDLLRTPSKRRGMLGRLIGR